MRTPSQWLRALILAGAASALALAYPQPSDCKDNPAYIQQSLKDTQDEFNTAQFESWAYRQEVLASPHRFITGWEQRRAAVQQAVLADATFTGLLAAYRGQLNVYRELLGLYETSRQQASADPKDRARKEALEGVKSARNLVFEGMNSTYRALGQRYLAVRPGH